MADAKKSLGFFFSVKPFDWNIYWIEFKNMILNSGRSCRNAMHCSWNCLWFVILSTSIKPILDIIYQSSHECQTITCIGKRLERFFWKPSCCRDSHLKGLLKQEFIQHALNHWSKFSSVFWIFCANGEWFELILVFLLFH